MEEVAAELVLALAEERAVVGRRVRETARVRVAVSNVAETHSIETALTERLVEVERVPIGRVVTAPPPVREEGRTLVIPVLEEIVVTERRLVLKEEVRLTFRDQSRIATSTIVLRRQQALVQRLPATAPPPSRQPEETTIMSQTITAMFDDRAEAERAVEMLVQQHHIQRTAIDVHAAGTENAASASAPAASPKDTGILAGLRDMFLPEPDRAALTEGVRRGGILVTVRATAEQADAVMEALEQHGAVDLDTREAEWRASGWDAGASAVTPAAGGMPAGAMPAAGADRTMGLAEDQERIALVEETLKIGKRQAAGGRVRVRSYVVETPVHEQVTLRDEHVDVQRRDVDRPMEANEALFQERVIEATETVEEAVISKEARVREEVVINKTGTDRVETVSDTVRRTEVEVERDGKVVPKEQPPAR